ncbi:PREDICTED: tetratricopeptide repeat protein 4-like [Prunus mume]|uniref:Tetratricopeptide repeat protein 4-like n=1 Tax=Prunus mume TaxID=102107 RepID=A0ABM1LSK9_PRUMU|nr:PREDICTED: tetratricopeptide repeat protein 4-like [Prunus mume]
MALLMEKGSEPQTESERDDLDAIAALKENTAIEPKDKGNEYVKMGKKYFADAIDCYTRAINQQALSDSDTSLLFSSRVHVNLLLGNYRRALTDAEDSIKLCSTNVKALCRASKAYFAFNLLPESTLHCQNGLKHDPSNEELKKLLRQIESKKMEHGQREAQVSKALSEAKDLVSGIESRGLKIGKAMYQELTGLRKPVLDKNNILHWPVRLLYVEVMSSDFNEDFCETEMLSANLDMMSSENCPPLSWDQEHNYTREAVELYYENVTSVFKGMPSRASERASARGGRETPEAIGRFGRLAMGRRKKALQGMLKRSEAEQGVQIWKPLNRKNFARLQTLTPQRFKAYASRSTTENVSPIRLAFENIECNSFTVSDLQNRRKISYGITDLSVFGLHLSSISLWNLLDSPNSWPSTSGISWDLFVTINSL